MTEGARQAEGMLCQDSKGRQWQWMSPRQAPIHIAGFAWWEQERLYRRLPVNPQYTIPVAVDELANCTAGGQIRFATNSQRLAIRVRLGDFPPHDHMPATGQSGFDCYIGKPGELRYLSTTRFDCTLREYECALFEEAGPEIKFVTLNFPLYQAVEEVWLGVEPLAELHPPWPHDEGGRIIFYGTSITQGGCASRPGMAFTNILSRRVNREFINLGFSGNGNGQPELARLMTQIPNPACFVLDYDANVATIEEMQKTLPAFIGILRETRPAVPILVISRIPTADEYYKSAQHDLRLGKMYIQRDTVAQLKAEGDNCIAFLDGAMLMDWECGEATVDGGHPTDLGFWQIANTLTPPLRRLLDS